MEIQQFNLKEFKLDENFKKQEHEARIIQGWHSRQGKVAIKQWSNSSYDKENEVKLLIKNVYHQNLIQFLGLLVDDRSKCIGYIMPYMKMGNLHKIIHDKCQKYDHKQISSWINQICRGIFYLHSKKIIHTRIKPSNILLGKSRDDLKLSSFEIVQSPENTTHSLTKRFDLTKKRSLFRIFTRGTPIYMAPEILNDENYGTSADTYSLSIIIWEILYRIVPYDHVMVTSMSELQNRILNGERPELKSDLSEEVYNLLTRCWNTKPSLRLNINYILEFSINIGFRIPGKETFLLLGGQNETHLIRTVLVLQNNEGNEETWKKLKLKLPFAICNHGAQFLNNSLYIFGGKNAKEDSLLSVYKLSKTFQWEKVANMNEKRSHISRSNVILNDQIWVLGGFNGKEMLKTVEIYNPETNKWKLKKEMNERRVHAGAAVVDGKIFCCGGGNGKEFLKSVECYDPYSDIWTLICDMPEPTAGHGAAAMSGNLIVMGGVHRIKILSSTWILDPTDKNAELLSRQNMSISRLNFSISSIEGRIFVCGGVSEVEITRDVEIFDGEVWKDGPRLLFPLYNAADTVIPASFAKDLNALEVIEVLNSAEVNLEKETILLLGGGDGNKYFNSMLLLCNNGKNWKELTIKLPYAIQCHGSQFLNNHLYIFGGTTINEDILNATYKLSKSLQWEKMANLSQRRSYISNSNVVLNDQIWALGGWNGKETLKSVEMYNPVTNKWKYMKEMNECRANAAVAVVYENIFCCGGSNGENKLNSVERYDPISNIWTFICSMPEPTSGLGAVAMNTNLIVIGGWTGAEELSTVWMLDTTNENVGWIDKPYMSAPRLTFSIAKIDSKIFICGGQSDDETMRDVEMFDGEVWRNGPKLPYPRDDATAVVIPMEFVKYLK